MITRRVAAIVAVVYGSIGISYVVPRLSDVLRFVKPCCTGVIFYSIRWCRGAAQKECEQRINLVMVNYTHSVSGSEVTCKQTFAEIYSGCENFVRLQPRTV